MKIVRNTSQQLILSSVPWLMSLLLAGFVLLSVGFGLNGLFDASYSEAFWGLIGIPAFLGIFLIFFVQRNDLILDKSRGTLEMRHATLRGRRTVIYDLAHLDRAVIQTSRSNNSNTYRVALVLTGGMDAGTQPVTEIYISGSGPKRSAKVINDWLRQNVDSATQQA